MTGSEQHIEVDAGVSTVSPVSPGHAVTSYTAYYFYCKL